MINVQSFDLGLDDTDEFSISKDLLLFVVFPMEYFQML